MKKIIALVALLLLPNLPAGEIIYSRVITITAGTAIRVVTYDARVDSVLFQMLTGGTGRGYVLNADPGVTCAKGGATTAWVAELAPATATAPGGSVTYPSNGTASSAQGGFNLRHWCVDGSVNGDTLLVSWTPR